MPTQKISASLICILLGIATDFAIAQDNINDGLIYRINMPSLNTMSTDSCSVEVQSSLRGKYYSTIQKQDLFIELNYPEYPQKNDTITIIGKDNGSTTGCDIKPIKTSLNITIKTKWNGIFSNNYDLRKCINRSTELLGLPGPLHPDFAPEIVPSPDMKIMQQSLSSCRKIVSTQLKSNIPCSIIENNTEVTTVCDEHFTNHENSTIKISYDDAILLGIKNLSLLEVKPFELSSLQEARKNKNAEEAAKKKQREKETAEREWLNSAEGKRYLAEQERLKKAAADLKNKQLAALKSCEARMKTKYDVRWTDTYGRETSRRTIALRGLPNLYPPGKYGKNSYFMFFIIQSVIIKGVPADSSYSFYADCIIDQDTNIIGIERAQH